MSGDSAGGNLAAAVSQQVEKYFLLHCPDQSGGAHSQSTSVQRDGFGFADVLWNLFKVPFFKNLFPVNFEYPSRLVIGSKWANLDGMVLIW